MRFRFIVGSCRTMVLAFYSSFSLLAKPALATDYYIDDIKGSDASNGKCIEPAGACGPWQTLQKINGTTFQKGDHILFRRGGVWKGQLHPLGSGIAGKPIVLGSYGDGNRPIIDGGASPDDTGAVYLKNQEYWIIRDLEVSNLAPLRDQTYRAGILVENWGGGSLHAIQILDNVVHDVTSSFGYQNFHDPHQYGGISVYVSSTVASDKFVDVLISGNTVTRTGREGIVVWDELWQGADEASRNIVVRRNETSITDGDGLLLYGVDGGTLEANRVSYAASYACPECYNHSVGMFTTRGRNYLIEGNEVHDTRRLPGNGDGQGFDADVFSKNTTFQYNYSHDNAGGGFLLCQDNTSDHTVFRYNISQSDAGNGVFTFNCMDFIEGLQIYNNVFFLPTNSTTPVFANYLGDCPACNLPYVVANNIFYTLGKNEYAYPGKSPFDSNVYFGSHVISEPTDPKKLTLDPQVAEAGSGSVGFGSLAGYLLKVGSPAVGSGLLVSSNGGRDFWGNPVSATKKPNRGAYEGLGVASFRRAPNRGSWNHAAGRGPLVP